MFQIDSLSRKPVYEQLIEQLERFILSGVLHAGDQLPSVRSLSLELSINPNTIQKAYTELDIRGIIYSIPGIGCFISEDAVSLVSQFKRRKLATLKALAEELLLADVTAEELHKTIDEACEERGATHD